ncbi:MAG: TatD family hydrolase [Gemmatimonadaceae bacterium]
MAAEARYVERFADSHAHLADPAFAGDRDEVISRARISGADAIVCIGSGSGAGDVLGAARASLGVASAFPGFVWFTAGVHPHDAEGFDSPRDVAELRMLANAGAVGIGECGLDYHYDNSPRREQRRAFAEQLSLAGELGLPVVVHTRDAESDTRAMVSEAASTGVVGVLHCYTGTHDLARAAIEVGWYVSFSGIVTFKNWKDDELIKLVPRDRLLTESDAPYLAPVPNRGKRNEPAWVAHTVARLAIARGDDAKSLGVTMADNARRLFKLA